MDLFKQTAHITRTYNAADSNISQRMRTQGNDFLKCFRRTDKNKISLKLFEKANQASSAGPSPVPL